MIAPGRRSGSTRSGPSSPSRPRAASASPATSSRPDDPRHRRHQRAAVRPPGRAPPPRSAATSRCSSSTAPRTSPHGRGEWVDFLPFDELAERARERARGRLPRRRRLDHARPPLRAPPDRDAPPPRISARRSTTISCRSPGASREAGLVTLVEDEAQLAAAVLATRPPCRRRTARTRAARARPRSAPTSATSCSASAPPASPPDGLGMGRAADGSPSGNVAGDFAARALTAPTHFEMGKARRPATPFPATRQRGVLRSRSDLPVHAETEAARLIYPPPASTRAVRGRRRPARG